MRTISSFAVLTTGLKTLHYHTGNNHACMYVHVCSHRNKEMLGVCTAELAGGHDYFVSYLVRNIVIYYYMNPVGFI